MPAGFRGKHFYFFIIALFAFYYYTGSIGSIEKRPEATHIWAQCDRASVARNYFQESMNFFEPRIHQTMSGNGVCGLEFPIMNYSAAIFYKIFGFHELWYRLIMFLTIFAGLTAVYLFSCHLLKDKILSGLLALIMASSPVLLFYAANFLPDTASLGFIFLTWYCFFKFKDQQGKTNLILFFLFGSLATLIKITSLISITVILIILLLDYFKLLNNKRISIIPQKRNFLILLLIIYGLVFSWYSYAGWINKINNYSVFLLQSNPANGFEDISKTFHAIIKLWKSHYFHPAIFYLIMTGILFILFYIKSVNRLLLLITLGLLGGYSIFVYLMLKQFIFHDYYFITLIPFPLFILITALEVTIRKIKLYRIKMGITFLLMIILIISIPHAKKNFLYRYKKDSWHHDKLYDPYLEIEPYLNLLGITHKDKVLSIHDNSPNISLYFMNVKGWRANRDDPAENILEIIKDKPKYFIANDSSVVNNKIFEPYLKNKIGQYENVWIFKL